MIIKYCTIIVIIEIIIMMMIMIIMMKIPLSRVFPSLSGMMANNDND